MVTNVSHVALTLIVNIQRKPKRHDSENELFRMNLTTEQSCTMSQRHVLLLAGRQTVAKPLLPRPRVIKFVAIGRLASLWFSG